jgi:Icc-related predicted phosphoesterase
MKIRLISDLHLEFDPQLTLDYCGEDIMVVAGDLSPNPDEAMEWLLRYRSVSSSPVVVVLGNHDYYGKRTMEETDEIWRHMSIPDIHVLNNSEVTLQGVRFFGAPMWTNMWGDERRLVCGIADFRCIPDISISKLRERHNESKVALATALENPEPIVVVTHHLPTEKSIHPAYAGSTINGAFASTDIDHFVSQAALWLHGHTHKCIDNTFAGTRVVCNPRGYVMKGKPENPAFNLELIVEHNVE